MNESMDMDYETYTYPGFIKVYPDIMSMVELNSSDTDCICGDIQKEGYSQLYAWFNYLLIICLLPWLSIFGLLTNVCNVFIFSRKRMINSANTYLFFLACSDFLVILTGVFIFWIDSARSYIQELSLAPYTTVYALPLGYMAQTGSIYFTVAAAVDCYVNVCWKKQGKDYCTPRRARQIIGTIAVCSIIYNSMRFPQFNLRRCLPEGGKDFVIEICPTTLYFTINIVYNVYLYLIFMTLLPFFFLLLLNVFIVAKQSMGEESPLSRKTSINSEKEPTPNNYKSIDNKKDNTSLADNVRKASSSSSSADDTITMIMVVILFLCCNVLALVVNLIETFGDPDPLLVNLLSDASNFLVVFNSSVNCLIYFIFNKEYRDLFLHYYLILKQNYCSKQHKIARNRASQIYQNGANGNFMYTKANVDQFGISRKADNVAARLSLDKNSPIWRPQTILTNSNTATTKLSPPEDETNAESVQDLSLQSPCSFVPSIHSELLLMDDDVGWEDGTILSATSNQPNEAKKANGFPRFMAEVKLNDENTKTEIITLGSPSNNTGSNL